MGRAARILAIGVSVGVLGVTTGCYTRVGDCCCPRDVRVVYPAPTKGEEPAVALLVDRAEKETVASKQPWDPPKGKSLFDRLGGLASVEAVVDDFLARLTADPRILANTHVARRLEVVHAPSLRRHLIDQICRAAGGPCKYTGRDMKSAHAGLAITESEWDAAVEDLLATLHELEVPEKEQDELLRIVGSTKGDVVGR
jgi:hemoglobin